MSRKSISELYVYAAIEVSSGQRGQFEWDGELTPGQVLVMGSDTPGETHEVRVVKRLGSEAELLEWIVSSYGEVVHVSIEQGEGVEVITVAFDGDEVLH